MRQTIRVQPSDHQDWVVREESGRELGHYPSQEAAAAVAHKVARKRGSDLLIYSQGGDVTKRTRPSKGWFARLFGS